MVQQVVSSISNLRSRAMAKGANFIAKLCMILAIVSMLLNIFLVLTLMQMAPQLQVISEVVLQDALSSNQMVIPEPFTDAMMDQQKLDEMLVRFYLTNRYSALPDPTEMMRRWGEFGVVHRLSTGGVYYPFAGGINFDEIDRMAGTKSVSIKKIERLDNTWTVELDVYTLTPGSPQVQKQTLSVVMETVNYPEFAFYNFDFINPSGFRVVDYRQTVKKQ